MRSAWVAGPLLAVVAALACAMPGSPPGGEPDRVPPRVVEVVPAMFDTLTALDEPVRIRFDERISERLEGVQDWEEAVVVSPVTSPLRVDASRRGLEISLVRGWEENRVYRVFVRPVFRDYFNNVRVEPIDLVFSTGAPIPDAALAGFVTDRITGQPVANARVVAVRRIDETPYVALSDTAGFFALRFVPAGAYDVQAWQDQDRDLEPDFFEAQDTLDTAFGVRDTAVVELALLLPDTTPARLARAEPVDSARVRLTFDDHFAPGPVDAEATLYSLPDTTFLGAGRLLHESRLDSILAAEAEARELQETLQAVQDSLARLAADTTRADTTVVGRAEAAAEIARARIQDQTPDEAEERGEPPRPAQSLILLAPDLLQPDSAYQVRVEGLTNIRGVPGGGGRAPFIMPPPPEPTDTVPADTLPADTLPAGTLPADSIPPETIAPDTVPLPGGG